MASRFELLNRDGLNPNTAFFNTRRRNPDDSSKGVRIYGLQVDRSELEAVVQPDGTTAWQFRQELRDEAAGDRAAEGITGSVFLPLREAMDTPDMFTVAAAGLLLSKFVGEGTLRLAGVGHPESL